MHTVFLSLGTNLGDKERNLNDAIAHIQRRIGTVVAKSAFVQTEPWGFESDNSFLNAAIKVETIQSPEQVLHQTQEIERMLGRVSKSVDGKYHDRIIDIDILLYYVDSVIKGDGLHISTPELTIPHPLMNERDFVLIPLKEIL
ncbi:MAG: 2-amino-4-hydroxy-6-hydroxymethyldihydropteridine diphosphokinase [Bacteroidaceae bacterium]|jgi:2-amino-4-hydroxy-6-hydroxymethyldihydropteridine diphosphokinase|nr:2-amino-4-hydroxy-6-hydroxymethyldihydropteridine diphosphokinase [Bacteroidaceae bacterium]